MCWSTGWQDCEVEKVIMGRLSLNSNHAGAAWRSVNDIEISTCAFDQEARRTRM